MYTFVLSFNKHILSTYSMPVAVLGPGDTVTKRNINPVLMKIMGYGVCYSMRSSPVTHGLYL